MNWRNSMTRCFLEIYNLKKFFLLIFLLNSSLKRFLSLTYFFLQFVCLYNYILSNDFQIIMNRKLRHHLNINITLNECSFKKTLSLFFNCYKYTRISYPIFLKLLTYCNYLRLIIRFPSLNCFQFHSSTSFSVFNCKPVKI